MSKQKLLAVLSVVLVVVLVITTFVFKGKSDDLAAQLASVQKAAEQKQADDAGQIEALTKQVADGEEMIAVVQASLAEATASIDALTAEKADVEAKLAEVEAAATAAQEAGQTQLADTQAAADAEKAALSEQVEALTGEKDAAAAEVADLTAKNAEYEELVDAMTADKAAVDAQVEALTAEKAELAAQIEALTAEKAELAAQLEELAGVQAELEAADAELVAVKADLEAANAKVAELEAAAAAVPAEEAAEEGVDEVSVMTYADYAAAELESEVVVETYVQAKQSWWNDQATLYTQDEDGAYFLYNLPCTEEEYNALTVGTKIRVTGYKTAWSGEVEIVDASFEIIEGSYAAEAMDATALLGAEELIDFQNMKVAFKGMTIEAVNEAGDAFQYSWDGSGSADSDSDLYFNASIDGQTYTFVVEYYVCDANGVYGAETDVYKAVQALKVGDVVDMEGFLYWYEGAQPHITAVVPAV